MKSKQAFLDHLRSVGINPDLRQEHLAFKFAVFPIANGVNAALLGKYCMQLKDHLIEKMVAKEWESPLSQITFSPTLVSFGPELPKLKVSHLKKDKSIIIQARIDPLLWSSKSSRVKRGVLVDRLVEGISLIKKDWLSLADKERLLVKLSSFI
jgi:hypothetical protein